MRSMRDLIQVTFVFRKLEACDDVMECDVLCLDVLIYCVSLHAVRCGPGNMSNGAIVYSTVSVFIWTEVVSL